MAIFERAIPTVLLHEGKLVDDKQDRGGITNYGISLQFLLRTGDLDKDGVPDGDVNLDGSVNAEDIRKLTKEQAVRLYKLYFWDKNNYEKIADDLVATKILDLAVNMGSYQAHRIAQRAVRAVVNIILDEDGLMGLKTLTAINMCRPDRLLVALKAEASCFYRLLIAKNPVMEKYRDGWLARAYSSPILDIG